MPSILFFVAWLCAQSANILFLFFLSCSKRLAGTAGNVSMCTSFLYICLIARMPALAWLTAAALKKPASSLTSGGAAAASATVTSQTTSAVMLRAERMGDIIELLCDRQ